MCGIAGVVDYQSISPKTSDSDSILQMRQSLRQRGPDQEGIFHSAYVTLVHTRLSVIDIENGRQPMTQTVDGDEYCLIYNGELYNTNELKDALKQKGYSFTGHSDTEILLKSYIEWGATCVEKLNGIFAFAVWDKQREALFIARDRFGVKPFFYTLINDTFVFASEIKALLKHPSVKAEIDVQSISEIILLGPGRTPGCGVFKNIHELCPATCGFFSKDGLRLFQYWELKDKEHTDSLSQTIETVRYLVTDAIERQIVSDVPICTFLSGGLDSSIISAIANDRLQQKGENLNTYSVNYLENEQYFKASKFQPNSDDAYIDIMNRFLHSNHHIITIDTPQLVEALFSAVDARDLPGMADVDASLLLFCKEVKKQATVALSGECADEIFGGYPWYRDEKIRMIDGFPWAQSTQYRFHFLKEEWANQIDPNTFVANRYRNTIEKASKLELLPQIESRMKEMMRLNLDWFMQTLLDRKDRMSMANGLEVRVPYCDYRIAEYLYAVPWEMKNLQGREKGLLRKAMEGVLPDEVLYRKKSPYPKTHHPAYLKEVSKLLSDVISSPNAPLLQLVKKSELEALLHADNAIPWYGQLMTTPQTIAYFLQINYWLERYHISIV